MKKLHRFAYALTGEHTVDFPSLLDEPTKQIQSTGTMESHAIMRAAPSSCLRLWSGVSSVGVVRTHSFCNLNTTK